LECDEERASKGQNVPKKDNLIFGFATLLTPVCSFAKVPLSVVAWENVPFFTDPIVEQWI
jgi:hypothetical protein